MSTSPDGPEGFNRRALFWISVLALFTAAISFSLRTGASAAIQEGVFNPIDAVNSGALIGDALGNSFMGFALSLLVISPFLDRFGAKRVLLFASACYILGPLMIITAPNAGGGGLVITLINWGMILCGLAWGATEASINPVTAALYPNDKTHRLNVLHAWWPAGIVIGGLVSYFFLDPQRLNMDWRVVIALITIPGFAFGLWALTQKFPKTQAHDLNVSFQDMLMVPVRTPSFWIFFAIMFLTASTELAPGSWVQISLTQTVGMQGILLLVYVSVIMFIMRHFAGALAHRISDMGLLWMTTVPAAAGLYLLSVANSPVTALFAATLWAFGVCFMWPTMLAAVAHRYPRGGAWTIGLVGFAGAMAIRFVLPVLGGIYDKAKVEQAGGQEAFEALAPGSQGLADALRYAAATSFQTVAIIPVILFVIFGAVWFIERKGKLGGVAKQ